MLKLLIAGNAMNALDSLSTFYILKVSPSSIQYEQNPIIRYLYINYGSITFIFKILFMLLLTLYFYNEFKNKAPIHTTVALSTVTLIFGFCAFSNILGIIQYIRIYI